MTSPADRIRSLYLAQCAARFDKAIRELPEALFRSVDDLLTTGDLVVAPAPDEPGGPLRVRSGPNAPRRAWTLAGLNHEYLVQLAHLSLLADALGPAGSSRVRVETGNADIVVTRADGDTRTGNTLVVEVKSTLQGMKRDMAAASGGAVHARLGALQPDWLLVGHAKPVGDAATGEWWQAVRVIDGVAQCGQGGLGWETWGRARLAAVLAG